MIEVPKTSYARTTEGVYLAYQVLGDGPLDLMTLHGGTMPIDLIWDEPAISSAMRQLASFSRLIAFDVRGFGSSSPIDPQTHPAIQTWCDDIGTVMDAVESERAAFLVEGEVAVATMLFAATYPKRVDSLVLVNTYARYLQSEECPWGLPADQVPAIMAAAQDTWGTGILSEVVAPSIVHSPKARRRWARVERLSATPEMMAVPRAFIESDVTHVLPSIQAPTLVISRSGDRAVAPEHSRYLASHIPNARLVELPGDDHLPLAGRSEDVLGEVEEFLTGVRSVPVLDRVLATVLFTDIVDSTGHAMQLGDRRWKQSLDLYDELVESRLAHFRGRLIRATGDGTLAIFDGPARAIECARSIAQAVSDLGFEIRAGLHTGEVELHRDDVAGIGVHIAARVSGLAGEREVLVSRTVVDLVTGSGIEFENRGEHELKGVQGTWTLFAVRD